MKNIYFDTETTGTDPRKNGLIQFAAIIEIDGNVVESVDIKIKPHLADEIEPQALAVNGMKEEDFEGFMDPHDAHRELCRIFGKYINKFDRDDKFTPIGYNVAFDMQVMQEFFRKCGDQYFGSWFSWNTVDPLPVLRFLKIDGKIDLPDYKLGTVCQHLGIAIDNAHDALCDITATWEIVLALRERFKDITVL